MYIYNIHIYILCQKYLTTFHCILSHDIPLYYCISLYPFVFPFCWLNHPFSASFKHLNFTYNFTYQLYDVSKANETLRSTGRNLLRRGKNLPSTKQAKWIKMDGIFMVYTCSHHQNSNENRCLWMTMDDYG